MRLRLPKMLSRKKAKIVETNTTILGMINKDKPRFDRIRTALRDGHKPTTSELSAYHSLVQEFGKKSFEAGKAGDKFGEGYYSELAKKLNDEVMNALKREKQKLILKD